MPSSSSPNSEVGHEDQGHTGVHHGHQGQQAPDRAGCEKVLQVG